MFSVDLHTHSRFFHGFRERATPFDVLGAGLNGAVAAHHDLDGVALTNHDYFEPVATGNVVPIPGIEITTTDGHVLVVGPDPPTVTKTGGLTPLEAVELAHDRGCAAILAHPYRNSTVRHTEADFDAVEVNGKHPRSRPWIERLAAERDLPIVGGSDAHYPVEVGRAYTEVDADRLTPAAVVAAIRDGRVRARVDDWLPHELLRGFYRRIHQGKGHLDEPEWTTPGVGPSPGEQ
ncbi:PHP-associated domain-containing protein [Halobacteriales archaeon Cl-PHB]